MNQAYSRLSTTHGHITDCKLLVCQPVVDSVKSTYGYDQETGRHRIQARALIKEMCKVYEGRSFNGTGRD